MNNSFHFLMYGTILFLLLSGSFIEIECGADNISKFTNIMTITEANNIVNSIAWSPDGRMIASEGSDETFQVWDVATGANLMNVTNVGGIFSVAWSPDGRKIATSADYPNNVKIWDVATGANLMIFTGQIGDSRSVAWSPDSSKIASGSNDKTIKIWDVITGANLQTFTGNNMIYSIAWSPDGSMIASGLTDGEIQIWNAVTGANPKTLLGHSDIVTSVAWSPNGSKIASGSYDNTVKIWDVATGTNLKTLTNQHGEVLSVAWSHDGTKIASGNIDGTISILDAMTYENLMILTGHHGAVNSVAWCPDDRALASGGNDYTIKIWGEGLPNPYVTNVIVDKSNITVGESMTITATIANNGTADANNIDVKFYDGNTLFTTRYLNIVLNSTNKIDCLWQTIDTTTLGMHNLKVAVGKSEKNVTVIVHDKPNIYVKEIKVDKTTINTREAVNITATIVNNDIADGVNVPVKFYDGSNLLAIKYMNVTISGTNITINLWQTTSATTAGQHNLQVNVEKSWKNVLVYINGIPNVYVMNLNVDRTNITIGKSVTITATIANNGTADAKNVEVMFYEDKVLLTTMKENITSGGTAIVTYEWNTKYTTIGDHMLRVVVGNSSKQTIVHINKHPTIILNHSISDWLIGLIILLVVFISLILGYDTYKKGLT